MLYGTKHKMSRVTKVVRTKSRNERIIRCLGITLMDEIKERQPTRYGHCHKKITHNANEEVSGYAD